MSSTTVQQSRPTSGQRDGLTVLNATSQVVLERTIVEAFVKLVVCRNITVQRVAAGSGHVLDSHTTQEEESPVILDVHRHEVGGGCSARSYPTSPLLSDTLHPDHTRHSSSPSSTQYTDTDQHTGRGQSSEDSVGRGTCDSARNEGSSDCTYSRAGSLPHTRQEKSRETGKSVDRQQCSLPKPSGCRRPSAKLEQTSQEPCVKTDEPSAAEAGEVSKGGRAGGGKHCEGLNTQTRDNLFSSAKGPGSYLAVLRTAGRKDGTQDLKRAAGEGSSMVTASEGEEEPMEHCSAEREEFGQCGPGHGCPEEKHFGVGSEKQTGHSSEVTDTEEQDVEMTSLEEAVSDGRRESVTSKVKEHLSVTAAHQSCSQSSTAGFEDSTVQGQNQNSDNSGNDHVDRDVHVDCDEGQHIANRSSTAAGQLREVMREGSEGDMDRETSIIDRSSQPTEDDAEQDMLLIDLSNTLLEQTPSNTGHEQTSASTDSEQSQPNTDSEQTQLGTEGEQTHENIDSGTSGDGPEQSAQSTEKPDPFFHLLTNFPVRDMSHSKAPPSSAENKTNPQKSKPISACSIPHSSSTIKEEPDDDCMITAAFISPSGENRNHPRGPVSHTVTAATSVASGRVWRGGEVGGAARRQVMRSRGHFRHTPVLPPLQRPVQGYQVNPDLAAAVPSTSAVGFPTRSSSLSSSSSHPDTSLSPTTLPTTGPAYIPNFLATTTSEVSERMDSGGVMSNPEDRVLSGDVSQTYQCPLCNKIFMHHFKYARHIAMCGGRRPFKCKICGKAFNQRAHLDTHMKFHMGIKRHRCDVCHKAYVMKGDLIRHLKTRGHLLALQSYGLPVQS